MPTDIRRAMATKLQLEKEAEFAETCMLVCFALYLLNVLLTLESPAFAAYMHGGLIRPPNLCNSYLQSLDFGFLVKNNHANLVIDH